jgi:hypothetical protein
VCPAPLGETEEVLGELARVLGKLARGLGKLARVLGKPSRVLVKPSRVLGKLARVLVKPSRGLGSSPARPSACPATRARPWVARQCLLNRLVRMDSRLSDQDMVMVWLMCSLDAGHDLLEALAQKLNAGASALVINPFAWENTMAALEWAITRGLADEYLHMPTTEADLERVRRVHALGSSALAGEAVSPDLLPLARQCLQVLHPMLHKPAD